MTNQGQLVIAEEIDNREIKQEFIESDGFHTINAGSSIQSNQIEEMSENQNFISSSRYSRNGRLLEMRKNDVIEGSVTSPEMIKLIKETNISETDLKIIYPRHEPKAAMESIYIDNVMWVKNGKRVRFGFCLKSEKEIEIREKNLEISIAIFLSIPGHHENITACPKHADLSTNGAFFSIFRLNQEYSNEQVISLPLEHNNDDHSMALYFYCVSSCLKNKENKSKDLSLNFLFFLSEKNLISEGYSKRLNLSHSRNIRITTNPGRDAGVLRKRPRTEDYQPDSATLVNAILQTIPTTSQPEIKRALISIPLCETSFFNRLQRSIEKTVKFEIAEYQITKDTL